MARTMGSISYVLVETAKKQYTTSSSISAHSEEPETKDKISLMFSACDNLNNLCISLEKLYHALKMKNLELRINQKYKGKASPQAEASPLAEASD